MSLNSASETIETETARNATPGRETHHCANCNQPFTPARADARYCSPGCRLKAHRAKAQVAQDAPGAPANGHSAKQRKPRPGGHKLRRLDPNKPKRPCPPTPTATAPPRPQGGQTIYDDDVVDEILWRLAHGETLNRIIASNPDRFPARSTINYWVQNRPDFAEKFARARDLQFEHWADNLAEVADSVRDNPAQVPAARLDSENKRWLLARLKPALYSERFSADLTSAGKPLSVASELDIAKALARLLAVPALPAPEAIEVEAVPVELEGEQ